MKKVFKQLSNAITAAADTHNTDELLQLEDLVANALARGDINLPEAVDLRMDIMAGQDAAGSVDSNTDYIRHIATERTLESL